MQVDIPAVSYAERPAYRWAILAVSFLVLFTSFALRLAWGNAALPVAHGLGIAPALIGTFVTAFYVGYVASNAVGGFLVDRFGPHRVIAAALVPLALATAAFGFIHGPEQGLAVQFLMGISAGVNYSATTKITSAWFAVLESGLAFGILNVPSSLAVVVANAVFPHVIAAEGWRTLYYALGAFAAVIAVLSALVLRDAPGPRAAAANKGGTFIQTIREIFSNRSMVWLALAGFGALWGTWGFAFWANALMIRGRGFSPVEAGSIMAVFGLGAMISKPLIGWVSDGIGGRRKPLILLCFAGFVVMLLGFGFLSSPVMFFLAAPLLGVTAFAYSPLTNALLPEIMGTRSVGAAAGLTNAFWQCGSVIVPTVVGLVFAATASYFAAFATLAAGPLFGLFCMSFVREGRKA